MATHLLRICKDIPHDTKLKLSEPSSAPAPTYQPATYREMHDSSTKPIASSIDQATFNLLLVELVVVCALPLSILDSLAFKNLLEDAAKVMRQRVTARINQQNFVSIVTDGWTDPNGAKIVNFMVVAPEMPSMFWSSWASGAEAHTSDNLAAKVKEVVEDIEHRTTARVVGIVTDNASNMTGVWDRLSHLAIVSGGCAAHVLNLLMKNLFAHKVLKKVHSKCVQLSRFVRDHTGLLDTFRVTLRDIRAGGDKRSGLTLPVPTRWYSVFNYLENVLMNREELYNLFTSPEYALLRQRYATREKSREKLAYITAIVEDSVFWENLRVVVRLIRPIRHAMGQLESDNEFASGVYSWFRSLLKHEVYSTRQRGAPNARRPPPTEDDADDATNDDQGDPPDPTYSAGYEPSDTIAYGVLEEVFKQKI